MTALEKHTFRFETLKPVLGFLLLQSFCRNGFCYIEIKK